MSRHPLRHIFLGTAATVGGVVLLLSLKPGTPSAAAALPPTAPAQSAAPPAGSDSGSAKSRTVTGDAVRTDFGPVQVRITVTGPRITAAAAVRQPNGTPRSRSVSAGAIPALNKEAVAAQSARIDAISGASYTSDGYRRSLQSALDKLGRAGV